MCSWFANATALAMGHHRRATSHGRALLSQVLPSSCKQDSTVTHLAGVADWLPTSSIQARFPKDKKKNC
jgi:hypothetical protein